MDTKVKKITISLTEKELTWLAHIMDHFTDYMAYDDRPDHGFGILKEYRNMPDNEKYYIFYLAGKLLNRRRKLSEGRSHKNLTK